MATALYPDICIIGAGSGGLSAAAAAAAFGAQVVLIEKGEMGGDCLNRGCVPSKALLAAAAHAQSLRTGEAFGIGAIEPEIDFAALQRHIQSVIETIAPNDSQARFTAMGVQVIRAHARFMDRRTVVAAAYRIRARRYVIATGSSPAIPEIPGLDEAGYFTSDTIFDLALRPEHLAVIGGGPVGLELAQAYRRLGSRVSVIESGMALGATDPELARIALRGLQAEGIEIHQHCRITRMETGEHGGPSLHLEGMAGGDRIDASHVLVAAGRKANLAGLDLEAASIACGRDGIRVDSRLRTSNRRVYAIGDAAGGAKFTHVAGHHAALVIRSILFRLGARYAPDMMPRAIFTDPELAEVGLSEEEARRRYGRIQILRWPFAENDRAATGRKSSGLIKIVIDRRGRILGAGIVGPQAAELIGLWSMAVARGLRVRDMIGHVLPYPTYGEIGKRAAIAYYSAYAGSPMVRRLVRFLRLFG